jgi:hypothetical protein
LRSDLDKSPLCCLLAQTYNSYFSTHLLIELHFTIEDFLGYSLTLDVFPSRILSCQYLCCHTAYVFLIYWTTPTCIPPPTICVSLSVAQHLLILSIYLYKFYYRKLWTHEMETRAGKIFRNCTRPISRRGGRSFKDYV